MKLETLIKRYKNLGYQPKNFEKNLEIDNIISWVYETHDIFIYPLYISTKVGKDHKKTYKKFVGCALWDTKEEYNNRFTSTQYFDNPYDAKYDAVRYFYNSIKFQKY